MRAPIIATADAIPFACLTHDDERCVCDLVDTAAILEPLDGEDGMAEREEDIEGGRQ